MEDQEVTLTPEAKTEQKEVFEIPSQGIEVTFVEKVPREDTGFIGGDFFEDNGEWKISTLGQSPGGDTLGVVKREEGVGYELKYMNGGNLPTHLQGWFTTYDKAESAGRIYLTQLWEKKVAKL